MKPYIFFTTALLFLSYLTPGYANNLSSPPKIGLALSGGGARGAAHIGVLRALEKKNIHIDFIAGTSMGAVIAGLYASGMSVDEIEKSYRNIDWENVLSDAPPRQDISMRRKSDQTIFQLNKKIGIEDGKIKLPAGVIRGQKLELVLQKLLMHVAEKTNFNDLHIPYRAIASDIVTNESVVINSGSLSQAMRASMAVPGVFTPVKVDGRILVDGGITNNLPIDIVREMGADVVIAVDIGSPLLKMEESVSILTIAEQLTNILVRRTTDQQIALMKPEDILVIPELGDFSAGNFTESPSLFAIGEAATLAKAERLDKLSANTARSTHKGCNNCTQARPVISYIRVENNSAINNEYLRQMLEQKTGEVLNVSQLENDIGRIYGLGTFDSVQYDLETKDGQTGLILKIQKQPWGPNYLQFGLGLSSDFSKSNRFSIRLGFTKLPVNELNGEWQTILSLGEEPGISTDLYQPLAIGSPWFIRPSAFFLNNKYNTFEKDNIVAETSVTRYGAAFEIGREFGSVANAQIGLRRYIGDTKVIIGDPTLPDEDISAGEFYIDSRHDTLNDYFFPTSGWSGEAGWLGSRTFLGADNDFDQAKIKLFTAITQGKHTLSFGGQLMSTYNGEAPIQNFFRLGGLNNLPGYSINELSGQNAALLKVGYLRKLNPLFSMPSYFGTTLQYGDVFEDSSKITFSDLKTAASVYVGLNSVFGPLFVGYGLAEGGEQRVYFTIGSAQ